MTEKKASFEQEMQQLQTLVQQLELGEISLEESLGAFEQGMALLKSCRARLAETETKVQKIIDANGGTVEVSE